MADAGKSLTNQVAEITKLVDDVQERLDQVLRALHTLEHRVSDIEDARVTSGGPRLS